MADLACGDLTTLEPLLRRLPLARARARARMQGWTVPCQWIQEDLLRWAAEPGAPHTLITCLFGLRQPR